VGASVCIALACVGNVGVQEGDESWGGASEEEGDLSSGPDADFMVRYRNIPCTSFMNGFVRACVRAPSSVRACVVVGG
jgi:hypothetical protein